MELEDFESVEFGICYLDENNEDAYLKISVDQQIKTTLVEMRDAFNQGFENGNEPVRFEPGEKYSGTECLTIALQEAYLIELQALFNNNQIPIGTIDLNEEVIGKIRYYFTIFKIDGTKELAIKRSSQFKGLLHNRNKIISLVNDSLATIDSVVFKLDKDFDFVVKDDLVKILHPQGFVLLTNLEEQISQMAGRMVSELHRRVPCINFEVMNEFITNSKTASKLVASIKSRNDLENTMENKVLVECTALGIQAESIDGRIVPSDEHRINFLQMLDRRQYPMDLTSDDAEIYVAGSRSVR